MKSLLRHVSLYILLGMMVSPASAEQYTSKVREASPSSQQPADIQTQLKQAENNPYGKALLLQQLANQSIQGKDYDAAASQLEEALAQDSLSEFSAAQMRDQLSQLYMATGKSKKVVELLAPRLKAAAQGDPGPIKPGKESYLALGAAYADLGEYEKALPMVEKAMKLSTPKGGEPPDQWLRLLLAINYKLGRHDESAELMQTMLRKHPEDKSLWLQLTAMHIRGGNKQKAMAALRVAERLGLLGGDAERLYLAQLFIEAGAPYDAGELLETWLASGILMDKQVHLELAAAAWTSAREYGKAIAVLERILAKGEQADLRAQIGQLYLDQRKWNQAAESLDRALQSGLKTGVGDAWMALGLARYELGQEAAAVEAYKRASRYRGARGTAMAWLTFIDPQAAEESKQVVAQADAPRRSLGAEAAQGNLADALTQAASVSAARPDPVATSNASATAGKPELTPIGAVRAGNADGSLPPWTGGITQSSAPAGYETGKRLKNPFPNDRPLYVIDSKNWQKYRQQLSGGHQELFKKHPGFRMKIYQSRRSVAFPQEIYDATLANETRAELPHPDALQGAKLGFPFRKPDNGAEVMWNHRVRYRSNDVIVQGTEALVERSGSYQLNKRTEEVMFMYGNIQKPADLNKDNVLLYYLTYSGAESRVFDFAALVHETADIEKGQRRIWVGVNRRLLRIPPIGYDQPHPSAGGVMVLDQIDMYNGAFDKYVWKLIGRREILVPYNDYELISENLKYADILKKGHLNPDPLRYEKHRVWVIEATEREAKQHKFGKRVFYVDEDSWSILLVDNYDDDGGYWNFQEGHLVQYYDLLLAYTAPVVVYDMKKGRYFVERMTNEQPPIWYNSGKLKKQDFSPGILRGRLK